MPTKHCGNCGFHNLDPQQCQLIGYQYAADRKLSCPYWTDELPICDTCGKVSLDYAFSQSPSGEYKRVCKECLSLSGTCRSCVKSAECDYENNPSTLPKAVEKRYQRGNQIIVVQEKNPLRIDISCRVNCECFSEEFGCLRENGTCGKYEGVF